MYALLLAYNADESAVLRLALQRAGFAARISTDLESAIQEWPSQPSDLVLLAFRAEVPVPLVRQIRAQTDVPFVILADPLAEDLHIELLEIGVDQIVFRPFSARLLISQLRGLLRRATGTPAFSLPAFSVGDLTLDPSIRTIQVGDQPELHLTRLEFRLLYNLMVHAEQVIPAETLVEQVWGYSGKGDRDLVRGLVKRVRNKVEPNPGEPRYILTVPGVGYVLKR
ncbi:MAG: response regulator transcription factor [Anaerolineales bacterium]|nr:response regulator transcription factor [Anaerolineales bacterium]